MPKPIDILERYYGHSTFRPLQEAIIQSILDDNDTFVLLPTGGGKSICFQIPALIKEGICIVVSPLIALMKDQVTHLQDKGIKAIALTSGLSYDDLDRLLDNCVYGNYKFLYLSPERLQQRLVQDRIQQMNVNLIAVDEAHCISQWGNDFRPAYKNIKVLRELHPLVNMVALTATARPKVVDEIIESLELRTPKLFKGSFFRSNLCYDVIKTEDKAYELKRLLKRHPGTGIVYVRSRKAAIDVQTQLECAGISSAYFHGGINNKEKEKRLAQWMRNEVAIMVATTAFGMGIDKADVRIVVHYNLPESLESYYQEAGRAGRDNREAYAVILKRPSDEIQLRNQFLKHLPSIEYIKLVYRKLCNYFQISYGEGDQSCYPLNFLEFCKTYNLSPIPTYNVLHTLDRNSVISMSQQFNYQSKLQFIVSNHALFHYLNRRPHLQHIGKTILRTYGGIFEHLLKINLNLIAQKAGMSEAQVIEALKQMERDEIVVFNFSNTDSEITFLQAREDSKTINRISRDVLRQHQNTKRQVEAVIDYSNNDKQCKSQLLSAYFGEHNAPRCGKCSVCKQTNTPKTTRIESLEKDIIFALQQQALSSRALAEQLPYKEADILLVLQMLLEQKKIKVTSTNTYKVI